MPDSHESSAHPPGAAESVRAVLLAAASELEAVGERLADLSFRLPRPSNEFGLLAELAAAADCVQRDLLADAVETLRAASLGTEAELRRRFDERRGFSIF